MSSCACSIVAEHLRLWQIGKHLLWLSWTAGGWAGGSCWNWEQDKDQLSCSWSFPGTLAVWRRRLSYSNMGGCVCEIRTSAGKSSKKGEKKRQEIEWGEIQFTWARELAKTDVGGKAAEVRYAVEEKGGWAVGSDWTRKIGNSKSSEIV